MTAIDEQNYQTHIAQLVKDRDAALLSMDKATIEAYMIKYDVPKPSNESVFWLMVHKARTGATALPMFERAASKTWLHVRGSESMDDGDVFPPISGSERKKYDRRCEELGV